MKEELTKQIEGADLRKLHDWACYCQGARTMLLRLRECFLCDEPHPNVQYRRSKEDKIYNKALLDLILSSKGNVSRFLSGDYEIRYTDHERDKKGKLIKCRAFFARKVTKYEEIR